MLEFIFFLNEYFILGQKRNDLLSKEQEIYQFTNSLVCVVLADGENVNLLLRPV